MLVSKDCLNLKLSKTLQGADDFIWVSGADAVKLNTIGVGNHINLTISDNRGCETVQYDHIAQWPATSAPKQVHVLRDVSATGRRNFCVGTCVVADWSVAQMQDFVAQEVCNSPCFGGVHSAVASLSSATSSGLYTAESAVASLSSVTVVVRSAVASLSSLTDSSMGSLSTLTGSTVASLSTLLHETNIAIASISTTSDAAIQNEASAVASLSTLTSAAVSTTKSAVASLSTSVYAAESSIASLSTVTASAITATNSAVSSLSTVVADLPTGSSSLQFAKFYFDAHGNGTPIQQSFQLHSMFDNIGITTGVGRFGGHYIELPDGIYDISFNFDFSYSSSSVPTDPRVLLVFRQIDTGYPASVDGRGEFEINIDGAPGGTYMAQRFVSVPSTHPTTNRFELALLLIDPQAGWRAGAVNILKLA